MATLAQDGINSTIINTVLLVLTIIFMLLRLIKKRNALGLEDWLLCVAMLFLVLGDIGVWLMAVKGGEGFSIRTLNREQVKLFLKMLYWTELAYAIVIPTIKFSILVSYFKIFSVLRWFRFALYGTGVLEALWFLGVFPAVIFQCTPIKKAWNPSRPGHCIELIPFLWANSIANTILDYTILLLPVLPVWRLQMSKEQKLLVLASFSLGSLASIASTMRTIRTNKINTNDITESVFEDFMWTSVERHCGIISACLPFLARYFGHGLLSFLMALSSLVSKPVTLLGKHFQSNNTQRREIAASSLTHRARYELDGVHSKDQERFPHVVSKRASNISVRQLV